MKADTTYWNPTGFFFSFVLASSFQQPSFFLSYRQTHCCVSFGLFLIWSCGLSIVSRVPAFQALLRSSIFIISLLIRFLVRMCFIVISYQEGGLDIFHLTSLHRLLSKDLWAIFVLVLKWSRQLYIRATYHKILTWIYIKFYYCCISFNIISLMILWWSI